MQLDYLKNTRIATTPKRIVPMGQRRLRRQYGLTKPHAKLIAELQGYGGAYE